MPVTAFAPAKVNLYLQVTGRRDDGYHLLDSLAAFVDIPACIYGRAVWVGGVGERLEPAGVLPEAGILLANPRRALPTAPVFAARRGPFGDSGRFAPMPADAAGLARSLASRRNDLTE